MSNREDPQTSSAARAWRQTLDVPAEPRSASTVRAWLRQQARRAGFASEDVAEIEVAVGEAITNAIMHGHQRESGNAIITVVVGQDAAMLWVEVCDTGPGFDPARIRRAGSDDRETPGGRGLHLMEALMHNVQMHHDGTGMRVRLERLLPQSP